MARRGSPPRGGRVRPRPEPVKRLTRNKRRRSRSPVADGAGMGAAGAGGGGGGAVGPRRTGKFVDLHAFPADAVSALYHSGPMCSICGLRYTDKAEVSARATKSRCACMLRRRPRALRVFSRRLWTA